MRTMRLMAALYLGIAAGGLVMWRRVTRARPFTHPTSQSSHMVGAANGQSGQGWFMTMKPYCNPVEVDVNLSRQPAPADETGQGYQAACLALAGRIADARAVIENLPEDARWRAAGVVFEVGHPIADAGDDLSAGPIMELVVEFWPNHYMALYHAGAANVELGDAERARPYLESFLQYYDQTDGWTRNAQAMLDRM